VAHPYVPEMTTLRQFAILVDLDGTLIDSFVANWLAYRDAAAALGYVLTHQQFSNVWGMDSRYFLKELLPSATQGEIQEIRDTKSLIYRNFLERIQLNRDLTELLGVMSRVAPIGLVTSAKRQSVHEILTHFDLDSLFSIVVTGDDVDEPKPDPQPYLLAISKLRIPSELIFVFEDSHAGIQSARSAGLKVVRMSFRSSVT